MRIGLDIDDVLADFWHTYLNRFGTPKTDSEITRNVQRKLKTDRNFWINLPVINKPDFIPELYCTKRVNPKAHTRKWLELNDFPIRPIYQVLYQKGNKADFIKGRVDVFIDDSISNMVKMNLSGVPCLLMNTETNQHWGPVGRIFSLSKEEILDTYHLFMNTVYPNFRKYVS